MEFFFSLTWLNAARSAPAGTFHGEALTQRTCCAIAVVKTVTTHAPF